ncbi:molybdopterin oxidoreductase family protein [Marinomonas spartinae]|uniref:molybdopterin oxidoreductase family protein n=1 Tax=Marinomonas spartinae TaxID=1792290 RepID=UPI0018F1426F|nr:nitrate reductase [Marinomonas spartinae]MBJ7553462.1 nitrate reductase [Marinomonas spartinae]
MINDEGWIKSTCAYCGVGCGIEARPMITGKLDIRGDKDHPSNHGKLCTKGIALGDTVIEDGRLLMPKMKIDKQWQETDWETALDHVAQQFSKTVAEFGPDSVAFYVSGQLLTEDYYVANKLLKGFIGTSNIDSNSRLCMASSVVGHKRAFGMDTVPVCYDDIELAELVILVGSNLAWCHPVLYQRLRVAKQANPNLVVVVIDPRRNESCEIADSHLALNPGADVALFNGLLHYLAKTQQLDASFIADHTNHFSEALEAALKEGDVPYITGLDEQTLTGFYERFAKTDKVLTIYSQGVNQSTQGSDKVNSIINCHLAMGKIGLPGCGPFSVTGQPNAMGGREVGALANTLAAHMEFDDPKDREAVATFWQTQRLASKPGLKAVDMFDALASGKIKAIWIMATNPVVSLPDSAKIKQALLDCPLVVVSDCIADTATTRCADIVLPAQGWSEKSGTVTNSERRISRQRRLMASPGLAKPDWWILSQVAQRMGFKEAFDYRHEGDIFREYAQLTGLNNDSGQRDLNLTGLANVSDEEYQSFQPQQWPVTEYQGVPQTQRFFEDKRFFTANHRANFLAVQHSAPKNPLSKAFPLVLNSGRTRDQWHTMTRTGLSARLAEHTPEPYVLINAKTAVAFSLHPDALACISNQHGSCFARVVLSESMGDNEIFMPIHWNDVTAANSKPCVLIASDTDSVSGQPEFKYTPVTIAPFMAQTSALLMVRQAVALSLTGYWSRQKITSGYLYHVESESSLEEVIKALSFCDGQTIRLSHEGGDIRMGFDQDGIMNQLLVTKTGALSRNRIDELCALFDTQPEASELNESLGMIQAVFA